MSTPLTAPDLVQVVHRFYPAHLLGDDPRYEASEEFHRLEAARQAALAARPRWVDFFERLKQALPDSRVEDWTQLRSDACWRCRVYLPGASKDKKAVVGLVSILAPVHALYASHLTWEEQRVTRQLLRFPPLPEEFRSCESVLDEHLHASFGSTRLPNDVLFTPVRDVQVGNTLPDKVQLLHCLFTDDVW